MEPTILAVLVALVLVVGIGALVANRRRVGTAPKREVESPRPTPKSAAPTRDTTVAPSESTPATTTSAPTESPPATTEAPTPPAPVEPTPPKRTFRDRLSKARATFSGTFASILGRSTIDAETWDDLEVALLSADVGVTVTDELVADLQAKVDAKEINDSSELLDALKADMIGRLAGADRDLHFDAGLGVGHPNVWMFVGVNGVGKTTTIGKLARQQRDDGRSILLAAGDTFRAAAAEQLSTWAERADADFVRGAEGGDPSSVIFDGVEAAAARNIDLVFADTAGRLHNKTNLMEELAKVRRVAEKGAGTVTETLLVIDATTGQNGLTQAEVFAEVTDVTGVVLTKLDGSAKGGIVFAIETKLGIPVKLVGIGEQIGDLVPFVPAEFVNALFDE